MGARLDYCNSLLFGSTERNMDRLQQVQNNLAPVVPQAPLSASAAILGQELHWLPVRQRVVFKLATLTLTVRKLGQPAYLGNLLREYQSTRNLRSADLLHQPPATNAFSSRSFPVAAPTLWNKFSAGSASTLGTFKSRLKTELFTSAYHTPSAKKCTQHTIFTLKK